MAEVAKKEATVSIVNLSRLGRPFYVKVGEVDGKPTVAVIKADNVAVEVPKSEADFLLGRLQNGRARFQDLVDASKMSPEAAKIKKDLLDENARLLKENEELKAKLLARDKGEKSDGKSSDKPGNGGKNK